MIKNALIGPGYTIVYTCPPLKSFFLLLAPVLEAQCAVAKFSKPQNLMTCFEGISIFV